MRVVESIPVRFQEDEKSSALSYICGNVYSRESDSYSKEFDSSSLGPRVSVQRSSTSDGVTVLSLEPILVLQDSENLGQWSKRWSQQTQKQDSIALFESKLIRWPPGIHELRCTVRSSPTKVKKTTL